MNTGRFPAQFPSNLLQENNPFIQAVQQGQLQIRSYKGTRQGGETGSRTYINDLPSLRNLYGFQQKQTVQKVLDRNFIRFRDRSQIDFFIPFYQQFRIAIQFFQLKVCEFHPFRH